MSIPDQQTRLARIVAKRSRIVANQRFDFDDLVQEAWLCVKYCWDLYEKRLKDTECRREPFVVFYATRKLRATILGQLQKLQRHQALGDLEFTLSKPYTFDCQIDTPQELAKRWGKGLSLRRKVTLRMLAEGCSQREIAEEIGTSVEVPSYYIKRFRNPDLYRRGRSDNRTVCAGSGAS